MTEIAPEDMPHLENLITGGLMRKVLPADVQTRFLQSGYARKAVGGIIATKEAQKMFWERNK